MCIRDRQVHDDEPDDPGHGQEMHPARTLEATEQRGQPVQLHRFPDRQPGQHQQRTERQDQPVQQALHRVVAARLMDQAQAEGEAQVCLLYTSRCV